jgi:hypothetical protein
VTANCQDFKVSGSLVIDEIVVKKTQHFDVAVSGSRILIVSSNTDAHTGYMSVGPTGGLVPHTNETDRVESEVAMENGTLYRLTRIYSKDGCKISGDIDDAPEMPRMEARGIQNLWFVFGSFSYFQSQTGHFLKPIWPLDDPRLNDEGFKMRASWSLNENPPYLPKQVAYYFDGTLRYRITDVPFPHFAPPPWNKGFTNFTYNEISSTNFGGTQIPTEFEFVRYGFVDLKLQKIEFVTGKIDEFEPGASVSDFKPAYAGEMHIIDKRFRDPKSPKDFLMFAARDGSWESPKMRKLYRRAMNGGIE